MQGETDSRHPSNSHYSPHIYSSGHAHPPSLAVHAHSHASAQYPSPHSHSSNPPTPTSTYHSDSSYSSHSHPTSAPSTPSSSCCAPPTPRVLPISTLLSRLRLHLPSPLYRSFDAVISQFHRWSDAVTKAKQSHTPPPPPLLKARQYLFQVLSDATLYLDEAHHKREDSSVPSSLPPICPSPAEQRLLMATITREWGPQLFSPVSPTDASELCGDVLENDGSPLSLDSLLHHTVAAPTFIIPLQSFPFFLQTPLISRSFSTLLGYSHSSLTSFVRTPLDLLSLRQYPDVSLLVPAFLSALSAKAEHYLHSSGWRKSNGEYVQLVAKVQLCYLPGGAAGGTGVGEGTPIALMATFQKQAEGSFAQYVLMAQQQQQAARGNQGGQGGQGVKSHRGH